MRKVRLSEIDDIEVIIDTTAREVGTPSVYDLEEQLEALKKRFPVDVWYVRRQLKWLMKKSYKEMGVVQKNPWWSPRGFR